MKNLFAHFAPTAAVASLLISSQPVLAQGTTAFTYQGQLNDGGTNANGTYTIIFSLYDAASAGNLIAGPITDTLALANGQFTVNLDFGSAAFNGAARYLDITVQSGSDSEELSPRVQVLPSPYALYAAVAATVTNGAIMNSQLAANAVNATNIQNGTITTAQIAAGAVTNANLTANAVNATNIASGQVVKSLAGFTDAVNLYAGENVSFFFNPTTGFNITNGLVIAASPIPTVQVFTSDGTFVPQDGVTRIMVEMWGGGGGGGSGYYYDAGTNGIYTAYGGGGGAGAYALHTFLVIPGNSYTVIVGSAGSPGQAGTASSFAGLMSAGGGSAGNDGYADETGESDGLGGEGGTASGGVINLQGDGGNQQGTGSGGAIWHGSSGARVGAHAASGPGGGGGGGSGGGSGIGAISGGNANTGAVIIYY